MLGITNPAIEKPLKVNATIFILGTRTVSKYKIIAFEKKENSPSVIAFRGREKIDRIGRIVTFIIESTSPPVR